LNLSALIQFYIGSAAPFHETIRVEITWMLTSH
jgi:hypothetical protein